VLIVTERHTTEDLKLYRELYEPMDRLTLIPQRKVDRSCGAIKAWCAAHDDAMAYTSWGKDSVVLLGLLCRLGIRVPVVYVKNGHDNPDCELVRDAFLRKHDVDYHEMSFDYASIYGTSKHWDAAAAKYGRHRMTGIRNDESGIRTMIFVKYREASKLSCRPLSLWTNGEIFAYIEQNNLPLCPVYGYLGAGRWPRERIRTHSLVGAAGDNVGRTEWEREYYPDVMNRILSGKLEVTHLTARRK
jgi:3'-phosphoadenosine 5'-phosphosulfate sulfotransferase (PAPS reductase)/FAD synthetase